MIHLPRSTFDDKLAFDHVVSHRIKKYNEDLSTLGSRVVQCYTTYETHVMSPTGHGPTSFTAAEQADLKANAKFIKLAYFKYLRADINASINGLCVYCNQIQVSEIDHYLPKAIFGEYAIFSANLVPSCEKCNKKKLDRFRQTKGGRRYLHPYFDMLPSSDQYLTCTLSFNATVTAKFGFQLPPDTPSDVANAIQCQFEDLDLAIRYGAEAAGDMANNLGSYYLAFKRGSSALREQLEANWRSAVATFGINHWLSVTRRAVYESEEFCEGGFQLLGADPPSVGAALVSRVKTPSP